MRACLVLVITARQSMVNDAIAAEGDGLTSSAALEGFTEALAYEIDPKWNIKASIGGAT